MLNRLRPVNRKQWLILAVLLIAVGFTVFSTFRAARRAAYWREHRDQPIESWMTIGYISRSYRVPPQILQRAAGLPTETPDRRPLFQIAKDQGRPVEELITALEQSINDERSSRQRPPPGGGP